MLRPASLIAPDSVRSNDCVENVPAACGPAYHSGPR